MEEDTRCCGSGTCIVDAEGRCWCGQQWDGEKMCSPGLRAGSAGSASRAGSPAQSAEPSAEPSDER